MSVRRRGFPVPDYLSLNVTASLRSTGWADADQGAIWDDVADRLLGLHVHSKTSAMRDAYDAHASRMDDYLHAFPVDARQRGAVFALGQDVVGLDLFDSTESYLAEAPKLIRSYAFELLDRDPAGGVPDGQAAASLLQRVAGVATTKHNAAGGGTHIRFDDGQLTGGGVLVDGQVVHLFAFDVSGGDR